MIPSAASQYNAAISTEVAGLGDKQSAGEPGMSDQLHVQQEWEQVLAGGMAGRSQLASLYSELRQAPQKMDAASCHQVDAPSSQQLPADWEWATGPAQRLDPGASRAGEDREHRRAPPVRVVEKPVVDEAGQSAMQAALLCQILQHSQLQAQQHQQEQRLQRARQAAGQAEVPEQPTSTGSLRDDIDQRAGAWRAPSRNAGSCGPGQGRAAGHNSGDPRQHMSAELGCTGSGSYPSSRPSSDRGAANVAQYSSAPPRPSRAGRTQSSLTGLAPARHAETLPAHITAAAAPARRPSELRRLAVRPSMPDVPAQDLNSHAKQIQPCHCKKSMCLKLYCDCFASGHYCGDTCVCHNCHNTQDHKDLVTQTIAYTRSRNPASFEAKRALARGEHIKGCNCKNSRCLKKYCECFLAKKRCSDMCRCVGCANQAPDAAELDQPNKAARVAPARQPSLPPQQAVASARERFPVPEAMELRFGSKIRQAPEPLPVRPSHEGQAERPLPPGAYVMAPRKFSWEPRQSVAVPPPHARPPISIAGQRFPLPEAYALPPSDKAAEEAAQSGQALPQLQPLQHAPAQRFPVMDAHVLKPSGQANEVAEGVPDRRCSADGTSASEAGTVFGRSTTPSPSHEHMPGRLGTSRSVTDDALSPNTLNRATFPAARFPALPEQASEEPPATSAALPAGEPAGSADAPKQPEAAVAPPPAPVVLSEIPECNAEADLPALPNLGPFLTSLRDPLTIADAHVTLSLVPKGGHHISESPLSCEHISAVPFPSGTLQKTVSDPFNEGEAAEWLLRLG